MKGKLKIEGIKVDEWDWIDDDLDLIPLDVDEESAIKESQIMRLDALMKGILISESEKNSLYMFLKMEKEYDSAEEVLKIWDELNEEKENKRNDFLKELGI